MKHPIEVTVVCSNPYNKEKAVGFKKRDDAEHITNRYLFDLARVKAVHETTIWVNEELKDAVWVELINSSDLNFLGNYDEFMKLWKTKMNITNTIQF